MGTDVHAVLQVKIDGHWETKEVLDFERDYLFFAILASIKNGNGFRGCKILEPVKPIAEPRGLPKDFELIDDEYHPHFKRWGNHLETKTWLGDHSYSWLTLDEIKQLKWKITLKKSMPNELFYITQAYEKHFDLNNVRIVFGFDS